LKYMVIRLLAAQLRKWLVYERGKIFLLSPKHPLAQVPTWSSPIQWVPRTLCVGIKGLKH